MAKQYSIAEARAKLPAVVDEARSGRTIELTRRGKPVAVVISLQELRRLRGEPAGFSARYKEFLKKHPLAEVGLEPGFFDALRDRGEGRKVPL
ncbi:MAG TPA: type II toxin-antitoxin system Phd/YefM family antitoxin [Thermoanaerobaculia bacterium]|nr:type II toxin-antitoxin system Phd/YefM family antitoxin [Thermoanaerobaculia bacterium]